MYQTTIDFEGIKRSAASIDHREDDTGILLAFVWQSVTEHLGDKGGLVSLRV